MLNMTNRPRFVIIPEELDGMKMDPCTTDILADMFDFADQTEADLDRETKDMMVGEQKAIRCVLNGCWTITLRRVS